MTRFVGPQCSNGENCNPGPSGQTRPARAAHTHGYCVHCWNSMSAVSRRVESYCDPPEPKPGLSSAAKRAAFEEFYEAREAKARGEKP